MFEESRSRCLMTSDDVHPEALTLFNWNWSKFIRFIF